MGGQIRMRTDVFGSEAISVNVSTCGEGCVTLNLERPKDGVGVTLFFDSMSGVHEFARKILLSAAKDTERQNDIAARNKEESLQYVVIDRRGYYWSNDGSFVLDLDNAKTFAHHQAACDCADAQGGTVELLVSAPR